MEEKNNYMNMMKLTNSISSSFASMKFLVIASLIIAGVVAVTCVFLTQKGASERNRQIYLVNVQGQAFGATIQDESILREAEVKDQLVRFHELFFNVPPNSEVIKQNLEKAFEISDKSTYRYYNDLQETGFYKRLTQTGSSQQVVVDSVRVNMSRHPYQSVTYCSQYIIRESNITKYNLVSTCEVVEVQRTTKNVHGLQIEHFDVVDNSKVGQRKR